MNRPALIGFLVFLLSVPLQGEIVPSGTIRIPNARTAAIGGSHAALGDDLSTLYNNPAGLYDIPSQFHITELTLGLSGPIFSLANIILQGAGGKDSDELISDPKVTDLIKSVYAGASLVGPLSFGYVGKGLGFAMINASGIDFASVGGTTLAVSSATKVVLYGGYAFRVFIPESTQATLDFGVNLKSFIEGKTYFTRTVVELPDLFSQGGDAFLNNPFSLTTGIGLDLGAKYSYRKTYTLGLVARDVFTPTTRSDYSSLDGFLSSEKPADPVHGRVPCDISLGFMYTPELGLIEQYFSEVKLLLDYRDIIDFLSHPDTMQNPILKIGFGAEVKVLKVLWLRAGMSEGLFSAGFGLDYGAVQFHAAMFGTELSLEPGMRSVFNLLIGIEIRL